MNDVFSTTAFDTRKYAVCMSTTGPLVPLAPCVLPAAGGSAQAHVPRVGTPEYWRPADPVVVLDPLNPSNNLGRGCFGFRHIQVIGRRIFDPRVTPE